MGPIMALAPLLSTAIPAITKFLQAKKGLTTIGSGLANAGITMLQNQQARKWQEQMYNRQLGDAQRAWDMQNAYNSPAEQMNRLKDAGLNPNLVYGSGAVANNSQAMKTPSAGSWSPDKIDVGTGINQSLFTHLDTELKQMQIETLKKANQLRDQDAVLKSLEAAGKVTRNAKDKLSLDMANQTFHTSLDILNENLQGLKIKNLVTQGDYELRQAIGVQGLEKGILQMAMMQTSMQTNLVQRQMMYQQIDNMKKDGVLKGLDIALKQKGLTWSDPVYMRIGNAVYEAISSGSVNASSFIQGLIDGVKSSSLVDLPKLVEKLNINPNAFSR